MGDEKLPITDHLEELRWRLIKCLIAIGVGFCISYAFAKQIFNFFISPLVKALPPGSRLIYTSLPEAFITYLKISFFVGIILATPVIFYQIWKFVMPGLYERERRYVFPFVLIATAFFVLGVSFATSFLLAFGVIFELPVIIFFLAKIGIVNHIMLRKQRKYAILINAIVSAVLTPPDVVSMMFMMVPLQVLYELSVWVAYFVRKRSRESVPTQEMAGSE